MDRFDVDQDEDMAELEMQGCRVRPGLFLVADKIKRNCPRRTLKASLHYCKTWSKA